MDSEEPQLEVGSETEYIEVLIRVEGGGWRPQFAFRLDRERLKSLGYGEPLSFRLRASEHKGEVGKG